MESEGDVIGDFKQAQLLIEIVVHEQVGEKNSGGEHHVVAQSVHRILPVGFGRVLVGGDIARLFQRTVLEVDVLLRRHGGELLQSAVGNGEARRCKKLLQRRCVGVVCHDFQQRLEVCDIRSLQQAAGADDLVRHAGLADGIRHILHGTCGTEQNGDWRPLLELPRFRRIGHLLVHLRMRCEFHDCGNLFSTRFKCGEAKERRFLTARRPCRRMRRGVSVGICSAISSVHVFCNGGFHRRATAFLRFQGLERKHLHFSLVVGHIRIRRPLFAECIGEPVCGIENELGIAARDGEGIWIGRDAELLTKQTKRTRARSTPCVDGLIRIAHRSHRGFARRRVIH